MAGLSRDFLLKKGAVTVASLRQKSFSIDFSSVDVTTDDSAGYQTLLTKAGKVAISVDFGGVMGDETLFNAIMAGGDTQLYTDFTLVFESGAIIASVIWYLYIYTSLKLSRYPAKRLQK